MKTTTYSFYSLADGSFSPRTVGVPSGVEPHVPDGFAAIEGLYDRRSHRFDFNSKQVVFDQAATDAQEQRERDLAKSDGAQQRIRELEAKQARRVRELLMADDPQLKAIDDEIATLRPRLREAK